jgi:hypothetical protein
MEINSIYSMNIFYLIGVAEALFLCMYVSGPGRKNTETHILQIALIPNSAETHIFHFALAADNAPDRKNRRSNHIEDGGQKLPNT